MKFLSLPLTSGHPASNGAIENRHKTLKDSLKTALIDMGSKHKEEWPQALPCVLLGRRASHQPDLDASAAHLCLGKLPSLPGQLLGLPGPPLNSIQTKALLEHCTRCLPNLQSRLLLLKLRWTSAIPRTPLMFTSSQQTQKVCVPGLKGHTPGLQAL